MPAARPQHTQEPKIHHEVTKITKNSDGKATCLESNRARWRYAAEKGPFPDKTNTCSASCSSWIFFVSFVSTLLIGGQARAKRPYRNVTSAPTSSAAPNVG